MASRLVRKSLALIAGGTITLVGVALLVLPGPGLLTIIAGMAILASEFDWAKRLLFPLRRRLDALTKRPGPEGHDAKTNRTEP